MLRLSPHGVRQRLHVHERGRYSTRAFQKRLADHQLTFGSPLPNSFSALLSLRIPHPQHQRDTLLARRWTQPELRDFGLVDEVVEADVLSDRAAETGLKEAGKCASGAWGSIKVGFASLNNVELMVQEGMYLNVLDRSKSYRPLLLPAQEEQKFFDRVGHPKAKL